MIKKLISIIMAAVMTTAFIGSTISAIEITPFFMYTSTCSSSLSISNGSASCFSSLTGYYGTTTQIVISHTLQKKNSNGGWDFYSGWQSTTQGSFAALSNTQNNLTSGSYRIEAVFFVYAGNNWEKITTYSNQVTI